MKITWQNEKVKDLAYLGGIIDGEGSVGIGRNLDSRPNRNTSYIARIQITNNNEKIIKEVERIYKIFDIKYSKFKSISNNIKWKDSWNLTVGKMSEVSKLSKLLKGFVVGKKEQLKIVEINCDRRLKIPKRGPTGKFVEIIDAKTEIQVRRLKKLNAKGKWKN